MTDKHEWIPAGGERYEIGADIGKQVEALLPKQARFVLMVAFAKGEDAQILTVSNLDSEKALATVIRRLASNYSE